MFLISIKGFVSKTIAQGMSKKLYRESSLAFSIGFALESLLN
jgi:hypothetical protein